MGFNASLGRRWSISLSWGRFADRMTGGQDCQGALLLGQLQNVLETLVVEGADRLLRLTRGQPPATGDSDWRDRPPCAHIAPPGVRTSTSCVFRSR
jgi:hypothetical protein